MKASRVWSLVVMMVSALVILFPWVILPVCGVGRHAPAAGMPHGMHGCHDTLMAVTVIGVLGILAGLPPLFAPRRRVLLASALVTFILANLVILFPTTITGVCMVATMPCVYGTKPALLAMGILLSLLGLAGMALSKKLP